MESRYRWRYWRPLPRLYRHLSTRCVIPSKLSLRSRVRNGAVLVFSVASTCTRSFRPLGTLEILMPDASATVSLSCYWMTEEPLSNTSPAYDLSSSLNRGSVDEIKLEAVSSERFQIARVWTASESYKGAQGGRVIWTAFKFILAVSVARLGKDRERIRYGLIIIPSTNRSGYTTRRSRRI